MVFRARKQTDRDPSADSSVTSTLNEIALALGGPVRVTRRHESRTGFGLFWLETASQPAIAKVARTDAGEDRVSRNAKALESIAQAKWLPKKIRARVPALLHTTMASGRLVSVESLLPGLSPDQGVRGLDTERILDTGVSFLEGLRPQTGAPLGPVASDAWASFLSGRAAAVAAVAGSRSRSRQYERFVQTLEERLQGADLSPTISHGNFWRGNLLFGRDGALQGVVDWDLTEIPGIPMVDCFHVWVREISIARKLGIGNSILAAADQVTNGSVPRSLERYAERAGITRSLWLPLLLSDWLIHVAQHVHYATSALDDPAWLHRNLDQFLDRVATRTL